MDRIDFLIGCCSGALRDAQPVDLLHHGTLLIHETKYSHVISIQSVDHVDS